MRLSEISARLDAIAPPRLAAKWDNVGLLAGDPAQDVLRVLFAVDLTAEVLDEAKRERCELVVSYHPPIFEPLKRVVASGVAFDAIRAGIAIYSPHTALDVAPGGTNCVLADIVGMTERAPLVPSDAPSKDAECKLVFFAPESSAERVAAAVFAAGAGTIGAYSSCSFRVAGIGTFLGGEGANPTIGERGRLERVDELRVEVVVPMARLEAVTKALRAVHPYEEPAFDLVRLAPEPTALGLGRIGAVPSTPRARLVARIKSAVGADRVLVAGPLDGNASRVAVCAGSGGSVWKDAARGGAEVYVTGEMRHHDALAAVRAGLTVVATLHSTSERVALPPYAARLEALCPGIATRVSVADRDPFCIV